MSTPPVPNRDTRSSDDCVTHRYEQFLGRAEAFASRTVTSPSRRGASCRGKRPPRASTTPSAPARHPHARRTEPHRSGRVAPCRVRRRPQPLAAARARDDVVSDRYAGVSIRCEPAQARNGPFRGRSAALRGRYSSRSRPFRPRFRSVCDSSRPVAEVRYRCATVRGQPKGVFHRYGIILAGTASLSSGTPSFSSGTAPSSTDRAPVRRWHALFRWPRIDSGACDPHVRASTTRSNDTTQLRNR